VAGMGRGAGAAQIIVNKKFLCFRVVGFFFWMDFGWRGVLIGVVFLMTGA
jgi:hypothetical protein